MFISSSEIDAPNNHEPHPNLSRSWLDTPHTALNSGSCYPPYSFPPISPCCLCPGEPNLVNPFTRSFSVIPTTPQSHNFPWFPHPPSMEPSTSSLSCTNIYGNWLHRASISPSQASLPPLSPGSEHPYGIPSSSLISPYPPNYRGSLTPLGDHSPSLGLNNDMPFYSKTPYHPTMSNQNLHRESMKKHKHIKGNIIPAASPSHHISHASDAKNPYILKPTGSSSSRLSSSPSTFISTSSMTSRNPLTVEKTLSVPVGIAVARQRQISPSSPVMEKECRTISSESSQTDEKCQIQVFPVIKPSVHSPLFNPLPALSTADCIEPLHPIKLEKPSTEINTSPVTMAQDYTLARENVPLMQSNTSYYHPNIVSSVSKPARSISPPHQPPYSLHSEGFNLKEKSPVRVNRCTGNELQAPRHFDTSHINQPSPQEQACISDEEDNNLLINESPNPDSGGKNGLNDNNDSDLYTKTDTSSGNESDTSEKKEYTLLTTRKDPKNIPLSFGPESCVKLSIGKESYDSSDSKFHLDIDSQYIPTLPVKSAEVINFISDRGYDRLVDSLEGLLDLDTNSDAKSVATNVTKPDKVSSEYSLDKSQTVSCTDGLILLSALALADETDPASFRRYSVDCEQSLSNIKLEKDRGSESVKKVPKHEPAKRKKRSESCISVINVKSESKKSSEPKTIVKKVEEASPKTSEQEEQLKKRRRKASSQSSVEVFDPWKIRRSERIFLHESYALSGIHPPDARRDLFEKTPSSRKSKSRHDSSSNYESDSFSDIEKILLIKSDSSPDFTVELVDNERVLINLDNLFYAGTISSMKEPDNMYTIALDGVKSQNRHYYSKDDLIKMTIKEVRPYSVEHLPPGTRICAFWAGQRKCLYAGKIANNPTPFPMEEENVFVEFDDGDKAKISIKDIRFIPSDFPIQKGDNKECKKSKRLIDKEKSALVSKEPIVKNNLVSSPENGKKCQEDEKLVNSGTTEARKSKRDLKSSSQRYKRDTAKTPTEERKTSKNKIVNPCQSASSDYEFARETKTLSTPTRSKATKPLIVGKKKQKRRPPSPTDEDPGFELVLEQQLWSWNDKPYRKTGTKPKNRKLYHREIIRDQETIKLGDCAVFLSTGRPNLPYVGRIDSMWESGSGTMLVHVKWFYHPEETISQPNLVDSQGALFESRHYDENDVQTISHKCAVLPWNEYEKAIKEHSDLKQADNQSLVYYYAGEYEPLSGKISLANNVPLTKQ